MGGIRYSKREDAAALSVYVRALSEAHTNRAELGRLKQNLLRALEEDVTARQREMLMLYYVRELNMRQVARQLGVCPSTVSRTLHRGEANLRRCLRYGAERYLRSLNDGKERA
ncbi:sigma-70 family RNA polymerase sigma factor [Pseudoflavonifractor phocaeensis]|uniref:sigma-70 family RNA polymerase sigma factor n=1 Tax=Pseudoflavonifractor phocaeensis TaxID=1870988 RepID=UPI0030B8AAB8